MGVEILAMIEQNVFGPTGDVQHPIVKKSKISRVQPRFILHSVLPVVTPGHVRAVNVNTSHPTRIQGRAVVSADFDFAMLDGTAGFHHLDAVLAGPWYDRLSRPEAVPGAG